MPSGRFAANGAWLAVQAMAHNLARWTARIGLGEQIVTTKTLRRRVFALTPHPLGTPPHPASATALALGYPVQSRPGPAASHSTPSLSATDPTSPPTRTNQLRGSSLLPILLPSRASQLPQTAIGGLSVTEDPPPTSHLPLSTGHLPCSSLIPLLRSSRAHPCPSVDSGLAAAPLKGSF